MRICLDCFKDSSLKQFIILNGEKGHCDFCGEEGTTIDAIDLSEGFEGFINSFKIDSTRGKSLINIAQEDWSIFSNKDVGTKILDYFLKDSNTIPSSNSLVSYSNDVVTQIDKWNILKDDLKARHRFLVDMNVLNEMNKESFSIHLQTINMDSPDISFYRARINTKGRMSSYNRNEMGAPSKGLASAGRANSEGIPFLYLSGNVKTTLYEVRSLFLDLVSVGLFVPKRSLSIVNFSIQESPFDNRYYDSSQGIIGELVAKKISNDLSKPMRRFDSLVDYVPTQFICEFIKYNSDADGICFKSSLCKEGVNYVIFEPDLMECKEVTLYKINSVDISHIRS
jgi:RES domain.